MKRYKLLKDLPTFKAGDEFEIREDGCLWRSECCVGHNEWEPEVMAYHKSTLASFPNILKDWFKEIKGPKEYWYIDTDSCALDYAFEGRDEDRDDFNKAIGNYFETEEEAEKAVEKLKAWKRLKDKGFRFIKVEGKTSWDYEHEFDTKDTSGICIFARINDSGTTEDLDLLFGGEE